MRRFPQIALVILLPLLAPLLMRVQAQYRFDHWTTDDGLPQNTVRNLVQTRDGYLWFTTFDGLVRFDGVRFTVFDKGNTPGIVSNRFQQIREDKDGALFAMTEEEFLTVYRNGVFTSYTPATGLPGQRVAWLNFDVEHQVIVYTDNGGYYLRQDKFIPAPAEYQGIVPLTYHVGPTGRSWWIELTLIRLNAHGRTSTYPRSPDILKPGGGPILLEARNGDFWAGDRAGVLRWHEGVLKRLTEADGIPASLILLPLCDDLDGVFGSGSAGFALRVAASRVSRTGA
jgi:hypothetical protein